ncbi:unnamed protein product, partial [Hapterophycus canaliculatus]
RYAQAARSYWEATKRDADLRLAWLKLSSTLKLMDRAASGLEASQAVAIENRVAMLTKFSQTRAEFIKSGKSSVALAVRIARTLRELGRVWEAEAWSSIAATLPSSGEEATVVSDLRRSIIKTLSRNTPWQTVSDHEELQVDLTMLPLPQVDQNTNSRSPNRPQSMPTAVQPSPIFLVNQAEERSLAFFGRTGDRLDEPGIPFYQTLGCGGGAIDFDLDGWIDLYLAAAGGTPPKRDSQPNSLWRNVNGTFDDVSLVSGSMDTGFGQGIAVGDVNEDGFPDLLVLN